MKKLLIMVSALLLSGASLAAQTKMSESKEYESINYRKGYRADVELSTLIMDYFSITTSHGYSFGNGLYVGGGLGYGAEFIPDITAKPTYLVPVFADCKYTFLNKKASPFLALRTGEYADITNNGLRAFVSPSLGIDVARFSVKFGYEYQLGCWQYGEGEQSHHVKFAVSFTL